MRHRHRHDQRGQILVIVAGGIVGIMAMLALVLEGGSLVLNRRDGQNQADLAALAGTQVLARERTDLLYNGSVHTAIRDSLASNGCSPSDDCEWEAEFVNASLGRIGPVTGSSEPSGAFGVRVGVTRTPDAIIGRVFAIPSWTVSTEATALAGKLSAVPAQTVLPIAICGWVSDLGETTCDRASSPLETLGFQHGQVYDLVEGKDGPFGFGWIRWGGSESTSCAPVNPAFNLDDPYDSPTGGGEVWFAASTNDLGSLGGCVDGWIAARSTVLVPIYDVFDDGGSGPRYHITGIAAFVVTSRGQPAIDNLSGYFVEYYPFAATPGGPSPRALDIADTTSFAGLVR
jgi:Flp pilus assembly protein TadG